MKKKLLVSVVLLVFVFLSPKLSFAQEEYMNGEAMVVQTPIPSVITPTPDYVMAYPGLLPNSPLYTFKAMRDRLVSLLISDPVKKAEFNILQADKRVGATITLLKSTNTKDHTLAISTFSKGLNYFDEAVQKATEAKKQGKSIEDIKRRMQQAGVMYVHLLKTAKKDIDTNLQKQLEIQLTRLEQLENQVAAL